MCTVMLGQSPQCRSQLHLGWTPAVQGPSSSGFCCQGPTALAGGPRGCSCGPRGRTFFRSPAQEPASSLSPFPGWWGPCGVCLFSQAGAQRSGLSLPVAELWGCSRARRSAGPTPGALWVFELQGGPLAPQLFDRTAPKCLSEAEAAPTPPGGPGPGVGGNTQSTPGPCPSAVSARFTAPRNFE